MPAAPGIGVRYKAGKVLYNTALEELSRRNPDSDESF